jgi:hypothetical protein
MMWSFMAKRKEEESTSQKWMLPHQSPQRESIVRGLVSAEEQARIRFERQKKREWKEKQVAGLLVADRKEQWELAARQKSMDAEDPFSGFWGIDLAPQPTKSVSADAVWKAKVGPEDGFVGLFFGFLRRGFAHPLEPVYAHLAPFPGLQRYLYLHS